MATKKKTSKKSGAAKSARKSSAATKSSKAKKKSVRKKIYHSTGILSKAKKVVREVLSGAARGAVVGAAEAGSKATGIGKDAKEAGKEKKSKSDK